MNRKIIPTLLAALATAALIATAQTPARPNAKIDPNAKPANPIAALAKPAADAEMVTVITSDRLFYDYNQKFALLQTNVVVVDPRIKITADQMTVFFDTSNKVSAIECEGRVRISQEDKSATAATATYDVRSGNIILTGGKPEVVSGGNVLTGDPIIFNRDNNTVNVPGTGERPRIRITPGSGGTGGLLDAGGGKPNPAKSEKPK